MTKIHMEAQKTPRSKDNSEEKNQSYEYHHTSFQAILQITVMVLAHN